MLNLSPLNETDFEELCYEILRHKGFTNINWRKGTGKKSSPSDNGRDIEAHRLKEDFDGSSKIEKYFIECKHYIQGVPPTAIEGALAWASAEKPDYLIIIASNFLSNPCKEFIEKYKNNNKPSFEIKIWENKLLELFVDEMPHIRKKWNLDDSGTNLRFAHKYHLAYALKPKLNHANYLIKILDSYNPEIRDNVLAMTYHEIIRPRYAKPKTGEEKISELQRDRTDYETFRIKFLEQSKLAAPSFVHEVISEALAWAYMFGDLAEKENTIRKNKQILEFLDAEAESEDIQPKINDSLITNIKRIIDEMPSRFDRCAKEYADFCEKVVLQLIEEPTSDA